MKTITTQKKGLAAMNVLIVDDDPATRMYLQKLLTKWGYQCFTASDGLLAQEVLMTHNIDIAIIDWMMPRVDGIELVRFIRSSRKLDYIYCILLTTRATHQDFLLGMEAGADDYLTKPFLESDLQVRLMVGKRIMSYQHQLKHYSQQLQEALNDLHTLQGFIHMCSYCNSVYTPEEKWLDVSEFLRRRTNITVSHGVCPSCLPKVMGESSVAESEMKTSD